MSITSTKPTSRRGYVSKDEVAEYTGASIGTITDLIIGKAEEMIDGYVGYHDKFMQDQLAGKASAVGGSGLTLQANQQNVYEMNYFVLCEVEIIGGTGAGQRRKITASTKEGVLTVDTTWTTSLDTTSYYIIYQLGKFPRQCDVVYDSQNTPYTYYKQIPEAIKRAVCAQYEYMVEVGDSFFAGAGGTKVSETIGDYSYTNAHGGITENDMISSKVKSLLSGYVNKKGVIIV